MQMASVKNPSKRMAMAIATLVVFSAVLLNLGITPQLAEAAGCTHGNTRWITIGCCPCNDTFNKKLQSCNNGVWVDTGHTQCFWTGSCCAFPCCQ
jgi:hypothetical protein